MAKSISISLRLGAELLEQVHAIAKREDIPASYILRRLIKNGLQADHKKVQSAQAELPSGWDE